ncbi:MAG: glycosyltransferase [Flavobacteriales bacterium]|nr:glycosyltransferase [Flavobacteriales bacterium]MCB9365438.1 glycosyltransferase [Flavobacteriales bacterium]
MKILYIPAENVKAKVSRSYFMAKGLSSSCELYKIYWYDNRNRFWEGKQPSSIYTAKCFLKSLFSRIKVEKSDDFGYNVYASVFLNAFIGKLIGRYIAIKLMRKYNLKTLNKIVKQINPDIIYHADGFYFFPALNSSIPEFSDLQDDINWKNIPASYLKDEQDYYHNQFKVTTINFIVSESAAKSFNRFVEAKFIPFDNGADFKTIRSFSSNELLEIKNRFNIPSDKTLISYIGGAHKFDVLFTEKLVQACKKELPDIHFLLVGNIPAISSNNVTNLGFLSEKDANKMYRISDIGITLKNTKNDNFLYNSVPLKFIQYAAAQKPIVTFPIKWSEENNFKNIFHVEDENISDWIKMISHVANNFEWNDSLEKIWGIYDWQVVANTILEKMEKQINTPLNK